MNNTADLSRNLLERAKQLSVEVAVAESLTGGGLASALVDVPGASAVFKLGVVAYSNEAKRSVLNVPNLLLQEYGAVSEQVALAMSESALNLLRAARQLSEDAESTPNSLAISTTGVAGPQSQDGLPPGTVFVAVAVEIDGLRKAESAQLNLKGDRDSIRSETISAALELALKTLV